MTPSTLQLVLRHAEFLTAGPDAAPDGDLVRRFAASRDEPAFAELVRRHGPMVWAACRHLLPAHADAEDAFQATFLALARSAGSIRAGAAVGGWLHGVAVRAATKLRRTAVRRRQREHRAAGAEADRSVPEATWDSLLAAVHEEVQRLPDPLRTAFVLCDLEGVRQPDAAARLGWKPGTLTGRLARARQLLIDRLAGRGLAPAVAGGAVGLGVSAAAGVVPAGLVGNVLRFTRPSEVVSPAVLNLFREVTPMTLNWWTKRVAAVALAAGGLGVVLYPTAQAQQTGGGPPPGDPNSVAGSSNFKSGKSGLPPGGGVPGGGPPGFGGGGGPGGPPPGFGGGAEGGAGVGSAGVGKSAKSAWEYKYVEQRRGVAQFKQTVTTLGADGWEYCDHLELSRNSTPRGDEVLDLLVFKRPAGAGPGAVGNFTNGGFGVASGGPGGMMGTGGFPGMPGGMGSGAGGTGDKAGPSGGRNNPFGPPPGSGGTGAGSKPAPPSGPAGTGTGTKYTPLSTDDGPVVLKLKTVRAEEMAATMREVFGRERVSVTADDRTNSLIVRGDARDIAQIRALVAELDTVDAERRTPPGKQ